MKKIISVILTTAISASAMGIITVSANTATPPTGQVSADKTAQWTNQEASAAYDLRIHGWSEWETAAYIGFTLPEDFEPSKLAGAELIVDTTSANAASTAYIYAADYSAFENGTQYEGTANAPSYTQTELDSFTSPSSTGSFSIDVSNYISSLPAGTEKTAFRIDVKSQNTNNGWCIGSCTNSANEPILKLNYGGESGIVNKNFSDGTNGWTISNTDNMTVSDGVLTASGTDYEARLSQSVNGLENGVYNLTAYTTSSDISGICYLYAKTAGHTMASTSIPVSATQQKILVPNVVVEDGKCDIGLYVKGSTTLTLDNFSLAPSEQTRVPFLKGGEISKLTYVEDKGGKFYYADGTEGDALQIMAENGFNLARIRVLNDPGKGHGDGTYYLPAGYQTEEDCLRLARRAKDKGMQIEFTFAYSDYWSDGGNQIMPHEWQEYITENSLTGENMYKYLEEQVYSYTKDIMQKLIAQGTCPEYVSIGNEMQYGMFFGNYTSGSAMYNNATYLARFVNAGAKAVRETAPESKIILHSDNGGKVLSGRKTFANMLKNVDFDVIGVSYYPFYNADVSIDTVVSEFATMINTYDKDVIIMETGYNWSELRGDGYEGQLQNSGYYQNIYGETQEGQRAFFAELYAKLKQVAGGRCIGDLYWDPVMIYDDGKYVIGWAVKEDGDYTDANVVSNSTIFDFTGKEVAAQQSMKYNTNSSDKINITGTVRNAKGVVKNTKITFTVNGRKYNVTTDRFGKYIVAADYPRDGKFEVSAKGCTEKINADAPYDGVILDEIDFATFTEGTQPDIIPTDYITRLDGRIDENNDITYDADYTAKGEVMLYVAAYDENNVLVGVSNGKSGFIAKAEPNKRYKLKAYLWNKSFKPLCDSEEKEIQR